MVRDGFGDDSGAKLVEQRGIDFAPSEDFIQTLKAAGASEAFLNALRAAKPPEPASAKKPLNQVQVFALLVGQVPSHRVTMLVQERGIDFEPTDDYLQEVRLAGGEDELVSALKGANVTKPATVDPAAQARQVQMQQHVAHGAELAKKGQYAEAEQEYRAALLIDSQNDDLYVSLANVLSQQEKWDDAASAAREALRLNPNNDMAHSNLGVVLAGKGDIDGMITEEREALRLNPNNDMAHAALGAALEKKGDRRGALEEYRAAYTLDPKNATYKKEYESAIQRQAATEIPAKPTVSTLPPRSTGEVLASAKTLCIVQENGNVVIKAEIVKKLLKWGRFTLVSSVDEADLIVVIVQTGSLNLYTGEGSQAAASLRQRGSSAVLWSTTKGGGWSMKGFSDASVGRAIADELTKFITSSTKGGM
jgi:tetratricopeptide (TPR) repeat protein